MLVARPATATVWLSTAIALISVPSADFGHIPIVLKVTGQVDVAHCSSRLSNSSPSVTWFPIAPDSVTFQKRSS